MLYKWTKEGSCLLPTCLLLETRLGPLAQRPLLPNSIFYICNCFKCSPNKHGFSYLDTACFSCTRHLLPSIRKTLGYKRPPGATALRSFLTSHQAGEGRHLEPPGYCPSPPGTLCLSRGSCHLTVISFCLISSDILKFTPVSTAKRAIRMEREGSRDVERTRKLLSSGGKEKGAGRGKKELRVVLG